MNATVTRVRWARTTTRKGPWHRMSTNGGIVTHCGRRLTGPLDDEFYAGIPSGFGPGIVCPKCAKTVVQRRRVIAEFSDDGGILVMFHDGEIVGYRTAEQVVTAISWKDRAAVKRGAVGVVTELEWRNTPANFTPPEIPS